MSSSASGAPFSIPADFERLADVLPNPLHRADRYDLTALPDPPDDWTFLNRTYGSLSGQKGTKKNAIIGLCSLHMIGIKFHQKARPTRPERLAALWKLFYYQRDETRPQTYADLFDTTRDAGPRLLKYTLVPAPVPVSRFFPREPRPERGLSPSYVRPRDAPDQMHDYLLEQFLYPLWPHSGPLPAANVDFTAEPVPLYFSDSTDNEESNKRRRRNPSPPQNVPGGYSQNIGTEVSPRRLNNLTFTPGYKPMTVMEATEKMIIKLTYAELERDPTAPPREPNVNQIAHCEDDLQLVHIGSHSAHGWVGVNPQTYDWDGSSTSKILSYRGRGPVWSNDSCSIDCIIVLGKLLDIGCTVIDRRYKSMFTDAAKAYIEATNMNWEVFPRELSIQLRDKFYQRLYESYPFVQRGMTWHAFATVTRDFAQFRYSGRDLTIPCLCENKPQDCKPYNGNCVTHFTEEHDYNGVDVRRLVQRVWYGRKVFQCTNCGRPDGPVEERRIDQLPLRLVMNTMLHHNILITRHTDDFEVEYLDGNGHPQTARYRWLGGIYHSQGHARVYFTDNERGYGNLGNVQMYDDALSSGVIMGGIHPDEHGNRVPPEWISYGFTIVVYERILEPSQDDLAAASMALNTMIDHRLAGRSVLPNMRPWNQVIPPQITHEQPVLGVSAGRFCDVQQQDLPSLVKEHPSFPTENTDFLGGNATLAAPSDVPGPNIGDQGNIQSLQELFPEMNQPQSTGQADNSHQQPQFEFPPWETPQLNKDDMQLAYPELFDPNAPSDPSAVFAYDDLWPGGSPRLGGATSWPLLPQTPPKSMSPSPMASPTEEFLTFNSPPADGEQPLGLKRTHSMSFGGSSSSRSSPLAKEANFEPRKSPSDVDMADSPHENTGKEGDDDPLSDIGQLGLFETISRQAPHAPAKRPPPRPLRKRRVAPKDQMRKLAHQHVMAARGVKNADKRSAKEIKMMLEQIDGVDKLS